VTDEIFTDDAPTILDRSTIERWATCPQQAHLIQCGCVSNVNRAMDVGSLVHACISRAIGNRRRLSISPPIMRECIETYAAECPRPDVQPDVVAAVRKTWSLVDAICRQPDGRERSPDDLLRYDGGHGERSGQLATDMQVGGGVAVRITGEVDLLMSTASIEELDLRDWKSGWKHWTASDVAASFQFQFYAYLVLANYPGVNTVTVRVFMTRDGQSTRAVEFRRRDMHTIGERINSAVLVYLAHHKAVAAVDVPAWPEPDKCGVCPCTLSCTMPSRPDADIAEDPEYFARRLIVLEAGAAKIRGALSKLVKANGADLDFGDLKFGQNKPKGKARAVPCDLYTIGDKAGEE